MKYGCSAGTAGLIVATVLLLPSANRAQDVDSLIGTSMEVQVATDNAARRSQVRVSQLADETSELLADYRLTMQRLDRLKIYNDHLATLVADQETEMVTMQDQMENFEVVEQEIVPLMMNMIESLSQFIELDVPFLLDERRDRVERLRSVMDQSEVTVSEKYRQIMGAYQIETTFGRDIEAYQGRLDLEGQERQVDFLRVGRILLAYQTPDRDITGFWNPQSGAFEQLPDDYRNSITQGLRIARKQAAPNLLRLPIPAPEAVQ